ncbi:MAG TPA: hypothetical protein EYO58_01870, partial [Flavobacteriales bacterium]|nr:hypothetical protein [Flavobacteriales bacterium]
MPDTPEGLAYKSHHVVQCDNENTHHGWIYDDGQGAYRLGLRIKEKLHEERSTYQTISVYDSYDYGKILTLDGLIMFSERDEFVYHEMLSHVALCSHPNPEKVLIIGGGDAGCLREILKHPEVKHVVQCDIDERVTRVCEKWFDWVSPAIHDPRSKLIFADGIQYIKETQ